MMDKSKQQLLLSVFGEIGAGKSSLLNNILRTYCEMFEFPYDNDKMPFASGVNNFAITTNVKAIFKGNLKLIDIPGSNDPDQERSDFDIAGMLTLATEEALKDRNCGINGFIQCITK